jgi:hypothetical protein
LVKQKNIIVWKEKSEAHNSKEKHTDLNYYYIYDIMEICESILSIEMVAMDKFKKHVAAMRLINT